MRGSTLLNGLILLSGAWGSHHSHGVLTKDDSRFFLSLCGTLGVVLLTMESWVRKASQDEGPVILDFSASGSVGNKCLLSVNYSVMVILLQQHKLD